MLPVVNEYVDIKNGKGIVDPSDPNCEGRITGFDPSGRYVYISNMNMPFQGTYSNKPISIDSIVQRTNHYTVSID